MAKSGEARSSAALPAATPASRPAATPPRRLPLVLSEKVTFAADAFFDFDKASQA